MSKMTPSSMSPVRNPQRPPSPKWSQSAKSWQISFKLLGYLPYHPPTWSMMSKMTPYFKYPVRNHQHPHGGCNQKLTLSRSLAELSLFHNLLGIQGVSEKNKSWKVLSFCSFSHWYWWYKTAQKILGLKSFFFRLPLLVQSLAFIRQYRQYWQKVKIPITHQVYLWSWK